MTRRLKTAIIGVLVLWLPGAAWASESAQGIFQAVRKCEAYQSFNKGTNPHLIYVEPGDEYEITEVNAKNYHWVRIQTDDSASQQRWVAAECGTVQNLVIAPAKKKTTSGECNIAEKYDSFVLAATWQPGFCEHYRYKGKKPECDDMAAGRLKISHLTLHGLWPNKQSCGISYGNCKDDRIDLSEDTVSYIKPWMPNFYYETTFGNYEWTKHGTCQEQLPDDEYFKRAVDYVKVLNQSEIGRYITGNIGGEIEKAKFYDIVEASLGSDKARNNFLLICTGKHLQEVRVSLPRDLKEAATLTDLLGNNFLAAPGNTSGECKGEKILIEESGK